MTITFGGVELVGAGKLESDDSVIATKKKLLSGKTRVRAKTDTAYVGRFRGHATIAEVEAIRAKIGTAETLVADATYTNCYIMSFKRWESDNPAYRWYEIEVAQDTAG